MVNESCMTLNGLWKKEALSVKLIKAVMDVSYAECVTQHIIALHIGLEKQKQQHT